MADANDLVIKIGADTKDAKDKISDLERQLKSLGSGITKPGGTNLPSFFNGLGSSMKKLTLNTNSLAAAFGKFYASYFLVIRGIKKLMGSIKSSMSLLETVSYFNKAYEQLGAKAVSEMGKAGEKSAEEFTKEFRDKSEDILSKMTGFGFDDNGNLRELGIKSLGIDPNAMLNAQAQFAQIASSMGVTSEYAEKLSRALTMLGSDLTSLKNEDFETTWARLTSGLTGQAKTVYRYGANILQASMQQKLFDLGINESITKLGQQDKALLRTIIMLDATRASWGDLSGTLDRPANQLRVLKASFEATSRSIGNLFLTAIAKVIPYINALLIAIRRLVDYIMKLFGIEVPQVTASAADNFEGVGDAIDDTADAMDSASKSAKKLKQNLLGIDELNIISSPTDSGGSGVGNLGGAASQLQGAFDAIFDEYQKAWDKAYQNMTDNAQKLANDLIEIVTKSNWRGLGVVIGTHIKNALDSIDWEIAYSAAYDFGYNLAEFFNGLITPRLFSSIGTTIAGALNTVMYGVGSFLDTFDYKNAGISLAAMVNSFVKTYDIKQLAHNINTGIKGALKLVTTFFKETDFEQIGEKIAEFIRDIDWDGIAWDFTGLGTAIIGALGRFIKGLFTKTDGNGNKSFSIDAVAIAISGISLITTSKMLLNLLKPLVVNLAAAFTPIALEVGLVIAVATVAFEGGKKLGEIMAENGLIPEDDKYWYETFGLDTFFKSVTEDFGTTFDAMVRMCTDFQNNPVIAGMANILGGWPITFAAAWLTMKDDAEKSGEALGRIIGTKLGNAKRSVDDNFNAIKLKVQTTLGSIKSDVDTKVKPIVDNFINPFVRMKDTFVQIWNTIASSIKDAISSRIAPLYDTYIKPFVDNIKKAFDGLKTSIGNAWDNVKKTIKEKIEGMTLSTKSLVRNLLNGIISVLNKGLEKLAFFKIESPTTGETLFELKVPQIPEIKEFANGGYPTTGNLFVANEAGPELVGTMNGRNAVASNNEITGIRQAIYDVAGEIITEMRNNETRVVLEGDAKGMFKQMRNEAKIYQRSTGSPAFNF